MAQERDPSPRQTPEVKEVDVGRAVREFERMFLGGQNYDAEK